MGLGLLRIFFPKVPFLGLSATVPQHIRGFIHTTLRFPKPCEMIQRSINRANICLMAYRIHGTLKSFEDLHFLIPHPLAQGYREIPKTMVFVDGLGEACDMSTALSQRLPKDLWEEYEELVLEYSTGITAERRQYNLERFIEGTCRIMVCTEACGMGLDVPDIERVIQWRLTQRCNLSTMYQRFGRAGRKPNIQCVGMLYYSSSAEINDRHSQEARIFQRGWDDGQYGTVVQEIVRFDMGLSTITASTGGVKRKHDALESLSHRDRDKELGLPLVCRATISFINTTKCRRQIILKYFGESTETHSETGFPNYPCCDRCLDGNIPPEILRLLPRACISRESCAGADKAQSRHKRVQLAAPLKEAIRTGLKQLTTVQWKEAGGRKRFCPYTQGILLNRSEIELLVRKAGSIKVPDHVSKCLTNKPSSIWNGQQHSRILAGAFDVIVSTINDSGSTDSMQTERSTQSQTVHIVSPRTPLKDLPMNSTGSTQTQPVDQSSTLTNQIKQRKTRRDKGIKRGPRGQKNNNENVQPN